MTRLEDHPAIASIAYAALAEFRSPEVEGGIKRFSTTLQVEFSYPFLPSDRRHWESVASVCGLQVEDASEEDLRRKLKAESENVQGVATRSKTDHDAIHRAKCFVDAVAEVFGAVYH